MTKKYFAIIKKIEAAPLSATGVKKGYSELGVGFKANPIVDSEHEDRPRLTNVSGYTVRSPTVAELYEVLELPKTGIPLGYVEYNGHKLLFGYPMDPPSWNQSILCLGVQGKGKSNLIKLLTMGLATTPLLKKQDRPAILIIDHENEYTKFTAKSQMSYEGKKFVETHGYHNVKPVVYSIHNDSAKSTATLSLRAIDPKELINLTTEVEARTESVLRLLINRVKKQIENEGGAFEINDFRDKLLHENTHSNLVHIQQRQAIARAILSPSLELFDQKGKTPLTPGEILKPGQVTVIDIHGLDRNLRRVVTLYLQIMLDQFILSNKTGINCLSIIDEAEELFTKPTLASPADREFVKRINLRMQDIVNRGRKHGYGILLTVHDYAQIDETISNQTNTKIAFGSSGAEKWIRRFFGSRFVQEISDLKTGFCRIMIKAVSGKQRNLNVKFKVPFVGSKKDLPNSLDDL